MRGERWFGGESDPSVEGTGREGEREEPRAGRRERDGEGEREREREREEWRLAVRSERTRWTISACWNVRLDVVRVTGDA